MKKIYLAAVIFMAFVLLLARTGIAPRSYQDGLYASYIIDGDTIELSNGQRVRYIGIDTPEMRERKGLGWLYNPRPYAKEAKDFNQRLVNGKPIRLEFDVQKNDKYGRLLAYVYVGEKMVNLEMVKEGYAMIYAYPPNIKYAEEFLEAQRFARENEKGLWSGLESNVISSSQARQNVGMLRMVEAQVYDTFLSNKLLILNCRDNFKVVIFRDNLESFPKEVLRSPESYFKY
ncbi:MAG: thermonuclease family protein, partial [Candidatus Omnitrophica bacterium]|nr:thermonuclease family protein [Candidatus Omnitrophota bacterium]